MIIIIINNIIVNNSVDDKVLIIMLIMKCHFRNQPRVRNKWCVSRGVCGIFLLGWYPWRHTDRAKIGDIL